MLRDEMNALAYRLTNCSYAAYHKRTCRRTLINARLQGAAIHRPTPHTVTDRLPLPEGEHSFFALSSFSAHSHPALLLLLFFSLYVIVSVFVHFVRMEIDSIMIDFNELPSWCTVARGVVSYSLHLTVSLQYMPCCPFSFRLVLLLVGACVKLLIIKKERKKERKKEMRK